MPEVVLIRLVSDDKTDWDHYSNFLGAALGAGTLEKLSLIVSSFFQA